MYKNRRKMKKHVIYEIVVIVLYAKVYLFIISGCEVTILFF